MSNNSQFSTVNFQLPDGWEVKKLGEVCEVLDKLRKPITKRDRISGEFPYYGATGVLDYIDDFIFDEKLILIGEDGAKWNSGDRSSFIAEGKYWVNNHAHVIRPDRDTIIDNWIVYFLNFSNLSKYITGLTVPKLNQAKLRSIEILIPPLPEQKRIVEILDKAFVAIDKAKQNAEQNLKNVKELFDNYLQKVFDNNEWKKVKLSDVTIYITDGDHMPPPKTEKGIPFITISNINKQENSIDFSKTFRVPLEYFEKIHEKRKPRINDVLYTVTGSYGIPVLVESNFEFCFQRHIGLIRPDESTNSKWLFYWILSPQATRQAHETATGTAQKTVSLEALRNFFIPKVSLNEQKQIVLQLDNLSAETKKLESIYQKKLANLADLKKTILQKAFNGEL